MKKEFWTLTEVIEVFEVEERFLAALEEEELLCPVCREDPHIKLFPVQELEKLRLAKLLVEEMGVNLPGVEIILRMREMVFDLRRQFDGILEDLSRQMKERNEP